jgi:hypothetical protein
MAQATADQDQAAQIVDEHAVGSGRGSIRHALARVWDGWKEITSYIGDFQARLLLTVFYFTVAVPFALVARLLDPLRTRTVGGRSAWTARPADQEDLGSHRRQF